MEGVPFEQDGVTFITESTLNGRVFGRRRAHSRARGSLEAVVCE
jgi:hypothetical protein